VVHQHLVPQQMFLTKGSAPYREAGQLRAGPPQGRHRRLQHRRRIEHLPAHCKIITKAAGLKKLRPGQIVFCVKSQAQTDEPHRLISAAIGIARPTDPSVFGYLSEHHDYGKTDEEVSDYAEDLAAGMLATTLGVTEFDIDESWDNKRELWKISDRIVKTRSMTQSAVGRKGVWTTVVAAAVLIV